MKRGCRPANGPSVRLSKWYAKTPVAQRRDFDLAGTRLDACFRAGLSSFVVVETRRDRVASVEERFAARGASGFEVVCAWGGPGNRVHCGGLGAAWGAGAAELRRVRREAGMESMAAPSGRAVQPGRAVGVRLGDGLPGRVADKKQR